ncbi:AbrB family transcriptional regulator [Escherichia coli]|nr:AbrB family transcriptional regulator [Escherichia coli]EEV1968051.1 AbrB family transcriptional regulator [Escherichia coli]EFF4382661.1 AbrB family transcriptional regulator [Escherichia coli]EHV3899100.1 AbrB family transcriptional regulator [Escherichia coli]EIG9405083.1 AbrB family transcriptional regulator [Escherichia coli]
MLNKKININAKSVVTPAETIMGEVFMDDKIIAYFVVLPDESVTVIDTEGSVMFIAEHFEDIALQAAAYFLAKELEEECNCPVCQLSRQINLMH